jgi:hypothetical protein
MLSPVSGPAVLCQGNDVVSLFIQNYLTLWKSSLDGLASSHVSRLTLSGMPKILLYCTEYRRPTTVPSLSPLAGQRHHDDCSNRRGHHANICGGKTWDTMYPSAWSNKNKTKQKQNQQQWLQRHCLCACRQLPPCYCRCCLCISRGSSCGGTGMVVAAAAVEQ